MAHWQRRMIGATPVTWAQRTGDLVASVYDLAVAARSGGRQLWLGSMADGEPLSGPAGGHRPRHRAPERQRDLDQYQAAAHPPASSPPQAAPQAHRPQGPQARVGSGEWARQTTGEAICSYPPEDLVIEDYGRFLKQKAKAILSEERVRVEPFTTSILDGVDIRETIRNWHQKKIFVRKADRLAGEVGAVVVIFDDDPEDHYQYLTTWLGEHQNESDMAFTRLFRSITWWVRVSTRRIRRTIDDASAAASLRRLVGFDLRFRGVKPERLLMAALDYSMETVCRGMWPPNRRALFSVPSRIIWAAKDSVCPDRPALPHQVKENARGCTCG